IYGLAWGAVLGSLLHLLIQLPGLLRLDVRIPLQPRLKHPGVREVLILMGPRVLGLAVVQLNFWANLFFASAMLPGSAAALQRAWILFLVPQGVIAQSIAIAVFPTFSAQVARDETSNLRSTLGQVLRAVLFLAIPATVGMVVVRLPIVQLIYEGGNFSLADSQAVAWALLFYALGLVSHSLVEIITRAFYAMHDTITPVAIGGGAMLLNVLLSFLLIQVVQGPDPYTSGPFGGLALANTIATTIEAVLLIAFIAPRVGGLGGEESRRTLVSVGRASLASLVMGGVLFASLPLIDLTGVLIGTPLAIGLGLAVFGAVAWIIKSEEARLFGKLVISRLTGRANPLDN
ncbi:MAG: oligosaccharide flippase family protein, partial [Chloroflexi bacterium]|nr:oligosaccharide flippase family protein [Chloroflexota bacterium]